MKIRCKLNKLSQIKPLELKEWLKEFIHLEDDEELSLKLGEEYTVYGIVFYNNYPFYYVFDDMNDNYPRHFPAVFFEIIDYKLSKHWILSYGYKNHESTSAFLIKDWAEDSSFYEKLIEGEEEQIKKMDYYKKLIDKECMIKGF